VLSTKERKIVKEGKLKARIIKDEQGKDYFYLLLVSNERE